MAGGTGPIVGRDAELARVADLVRGDGPAALLVVGDPGSGKTTLLEHAAAAARAAGQTVLVARVAGEEQNLAYACLHRLLLPVLDRVGLLPASQRAALESIFGLAPAAGPVRSSDPLLPALGALTLLSELADDEHRVLVAVDDLHRADAASARVLSFVASRLDGDLVGLLASTRPVGLDTWDLDVLPLGPLTEVAAAALADLQPDPPRGERRRRVLAHAEGNPLAVVELARADVRLPVDGDVPVPLTSRLEVAFADRYDELPEPTRRLLRLAAAAGADDLPAVLSGSAAAGLGDWEPAERVGLVRLGAPGEPPVRFRHPLVRSGVYARATFAQRRAAHLELAGLLGGDLDRVAWHRAAAAVGPDERTATLLDDTAERARARSGWAAAGRALERAAELTADRHLSAERLLRAAGCAMNAGQAQWVLDLVGRLDAAVDDEAQRRQAAAFAGWALSLTTRHAEAVDVLVGPAEALGRAVLEPVGVSAREIDPSAAEPVAPAVAETAVSALAPAAVAAYFSGDRALATRILAALAGLGTVQAPQAIWVRAACDPLGTAAQTASAVEQVVARAGGLGAADHVTLNNLGGAAWVVDESRRACEVLGTYLGRLGHGGLLAASSAALNAYANALVDTGRWDEAWAALTEAVEFASSIGADAVRRSAQSTLAVLAARRGDPDVGRLTALALADLDPDVSRAVGVRVRWALGLAAIGEGDWERSYGMLRLLLDRDGAPAHAHLALYGLVDLVTCALRTGRTAEARAAAGSLGSAVAGGASARLRMLAAHAAALVAVDDDAAESAYGAALGEPRAGEWPFERARVQADHGAWLRRRRRVVEARTALAAAAETFGRLGARPYASWVAGELRAAGGRRAGMAYARAGDDAMSGLTSQERQIVLLAAAGLTNREIGEQLFLSPRTVGFHLHHVFPRLGVTSRAQLRDLVDTRRDG